MELPVADQELDCQGLLCPVPIIRTSKTVKQMEVGQVLKMVATDPGSMPDMEAWARQTGHELLSASEEEKVYTFYIRLTK
ncbi:MAG TPA: sulfurtransferase TusA family protein [Nitrospinae bacterium]|nr:sulfurtransferase TusA family protein [Nitrospinota bacterium]